MHIEHAILWLAAPLLVAAAWWIARRGYAALEPWARRSSLALRSLILLLILGGLSQPEILRASSRSHAIFLLDVSRSCGTANLEAAIEEIERLAARESEAAGRLISVVVFGDDAEILAAPAPAWNGFDDGARARILHAESLPELHAERAALVSSGADVTEIDARIQAVEDLRDRVAGEHSDIEGAMRLAMNLGNSQEARTIYLLSDGQFNRGDPNEAMALAKASGAALQWVVLDRDDAAEVAATRLTLPRRVRVNESFTADLRIASSTEAVAAVLIYRDGALVHEEAADLERGENRLEIPRLSFREKGFHTIEAVIRAENDTEPRNNRVRALVTVPGETRVLYVDAEEDLSPYLKSALELEGMRVEARPAAGVPASLSELLSFDVFVLCNVPAEQLSMRQMQMIRTYVEDFGGGFIMLGGEESFGLGGYFNTPVEEVLPVRMPIQKDLTRPSLALVLVIDKSGSMSGAKIELAKRAALASAEAINPRDQIAVVGFDSASRVIMDLTSAGDRANVAAQIASLDAGGGTHLYPALEDAHRILLASAAPKRHVIVLSDGQTEGFGYEEKVAQMAGEGITLSTVGIGDGADMDLLESMAGAGGGRAYFTNDFFSIPQIFTREALRASKNMLVERLVTPIAIAEDEALREIDSEELPLLSGYVATTPRAAADTIIISDSGDPILAKWRFGLGRSAAFTSDTKPRWAEDWIQWADFAKFWSQLLRSVAGEDLAQELSIDLAHDVGTRDGVELEIDIRDSQDDFADEVAVTAALVDDQGARRELVVHRTAPGLFETALETIEYGRDQRLSWQVERIAAPDEPIVIPYGFVYSFSPEFETLGPNVAWREEVEARGECMVRSVGDGEVLAQTGRSVGRVALWPWLLAAGLLLVPLDILVRRVG